jgi:hypothetical protein
MIDLSQKIFEPIFISSAMECTAWSCSSNTRDPGEREADRQRQLHMLHWVHDQKLRQHRALRGFLNENPNGSDI